MNFLFFFLSQQASNGINGRGERNGRDVTQVGSEFFSKVKHSRAGSSFWMNRMIFSFFFRV